MMPDVSRVRNRKRAQIYQEETYSINISKSLGHIVTFLRALGFWPFEDMAFTMKRRKRPILIFIILSLLVSIILGSLNLLDMISNSSTLRETLFHFLFIVRTLCALFAMWVFLSRSEEISIILNLFANFKAPYELQKLMVKFCKSIQKPSKKVSYYYFLTFMIIVPNALVAPHLNSVGDSVLKKESLQKPTYNIHTELLYYPRMILGTPGMLVMTGLHLLYLSLLILVSRLLDHLVDALNILHTPKKLKYGLFPIIAKRTNETYQQIVEKTLKYAVQHYQRTTELIDLTNSIFSIMKLSDIWSLALASCVLGIEISNPKMTVGDFLVKLHIFLLELSYFWLVCYFANEIIIKSTERLQSSCYGSAMLNWSSSNQRTARIIRLRADKALQLRAGPFYTLSLYTFRVILGISLSFFSFLYQVQKWKS